MRGRNCWTTTAPACPRESCERARPLGRTLCREGCWCNAHSFEADKCLETRCWALLKRTGSDSLPHTRISGLISGLGCGYFFRMLSFGGLPILVIESAAIAAAVMADGGRPGVRGRRWLDPGVAVGSSKCEFCRRGHSCCRSGWSSSLVSRIRHAS